LAHEIYFSIYCIGNVITPTDELIFFRGVDTTNQNMWMYDGSWMDDGHLLMMIYGVSSCFIHILDVEKYLG
jgi:hypothetical protein